MSVPTAVLFLRSLGLGRERVRGNGKEREETSGIIGILEVGEVSSLKREKMIYDVHSQYFQTFLTTSGVQK